MVGSGVGGSAEQALLWQGVMALRANGKVKGTWTNMRVAVDAWIKYRVFLQASCWLPNAATGSTEEWLNCAHCESFISFMFSHLRVKCATTALAYVAGVGAAHEYEGRQNPWARKNRFLKDTIAGAKRLHPSGSNVKEVLTVPIIRALFETRFFDIRTRFGRMLRLLIVVAMFGMLRSQSLVVQSSAKFTPSADLSIADVSESTVRGKRRVFFLIKGGKTDQIKVGRLQPFEQLSPEFADICVPTLTRAWLQQDCAGLKPESPMFSNDYGRACNYRTYNKFLKLGIAEIGLTPNNYASHSARSGGATAAFAAGVDMELIKQCGNWRSSAVLRYTRPCIEPLLSVGPAIASAVFTTLPRRRGGIQETLFPNSKRAGSRGPSRS